MTVILIVEDNPRNLKLVRDLLEHAGHTTLEAATAEFVAFCDCDASLDPGRARDFVELLRGDADLVDIQFRRLVGVNVVQRRGHADDCVAV